MLKYKNKRFVSVSEWDSLVRQVYKRPYSFQQQDGCKERGTYSITIPDNAYDYGNDTIPEEINGDEMGVSFQAWLSRDPKEWHGEARDANFKVLFWERNFYPEIQMVANDLHKRRLIEAGEYVIDIDW